MKPTHPPIHPGQHLAEELKQLNLSAAAFARQIAIPTYRVTQILNGQRSITGDTALRLAHFFGTSAAFWLNLQSLYELRIAERNAGKTIQSLPTIKDLQPAQMEAAAQSQSTSCPSPAVPLHTARLRLAIAALSRRYTITPVSCPGSRESIFTSGAYQKQKQDAGFCQERPHFTSLLSID